MRVRSPLKPRGLDEGPPQARAERPEIPHVLSFALALWAACAACLHALRTSSLHACMLHGCMWAAVALALACGGALAVRRRGARLPHAFVWLCMAGAVAGACLGCAQAAQLHAHVAKLADGMGGTYRFLVVEDPSTGDFGSSAVVRTHLAGIGDVRLLARLPASANLGCWSRFSASCRIEGFTDEAPSSAWRKGCVGRVSIASFEPDAAIGPFQALSQVRFRVLSRLGAYESDGALLVESIALGSRDRLFSSTLYGQVKTVGLAHVVAVSGAHLAIVSSFVAALGRALHARRKTVAVVQIALLCGFLVLAGAPHSALRAAMMASCAICAVFARRRGWALNALGICIALLVVMRPAIALSLSFALSAFATLSILVFSGYASAWFDQLCAGRFRWLCDVLGMTFAAIAGTAPLAWGMFGQLPLAAPVAGVAAVPACTALCLGGLVAGFAYVLVPPVGEVALRLVVELGDACGKAIGALASVPYACLGVPASPVALGAVFGLAALCLYVAWPPPSRRKACAAICLAWLALAASVVVLPRLHGDELVLLDVGQGDAILLRSGVQAMLVDTGNQDAKVTKALARHDVHELDLLVITHPDDDHCGSLEAVCQTVAVRKVGVARDLLANEGANCASLRKRLEGFEVVPLDVGDTVAFGAFRAQVLWPDRYHEDGGNQDSVVMGVAADCNHDGIDDWSLLLTGDAEADTLGRLVQEGAVGQVDILKVGHHGSRASVDAQLARSLKPRLALVSVGQNNRYGHPAPEAIEALEDVGAHVLRTDQLGDVSCRLGAQSLSVDDAR